MPMNNWSKSKMILSIFLYLNFNMLNRNITMVLLSQIKKKNYIVFFSVLAAFVYRYFAQYLLQYSFTGEIYNI